jgi:hypothetical protein
MAQHTHSEPYVNKLTELHGSKDMAQAVVDCKLVVVMGWDCRLSTAACGLLYYPRMIVNVSQ